MGEFIARPETIAQKYEMLDRALNWLLPLLNSIGAEYEVTGGFAAHLYGCDPTNQ